MCVTSHAAEVVEPKYKTKGNIVYPFFRRKRINSSLLIKSAAVIMLVGMAVLFYLWLALIALAV